MPYMKNAPVLHGQVRPQSWDLYCLRPAGIAGVDGRAHLHAEMVQFSGYGGCFSSPLYSLVEDADEHGSRISKDCQGSCCSAQ